MILLSRMLNRRFGFAPKIFPVFSSAEAEIAPLRQVVSATDQNAAGGVESDSRDADALLFVHAPRTTGRQPPRHSSIAIAAEYRKRR